MLLCVALAFVACSGESHTYWNVKKKQTAEETLEYYALIHVKGVSSFNPIDEVWVNVSGFAESEAEISVSFATTATSISYNNVQNVKIDRLFASDAEGWVKLCDGINAMRQYCLVKLSDSLHFNEIFFVAQDGSLFELEIHEAGERNPTHTSSKKVYDLDNVSDAEPGSAEAQLADKIIDEQGAFDRAAAEAFYNKALALKAAEEEKRSNGEKDGSVK